MTFSIIARCERSGAFGAAITTSDLAVGARCVRLSHGRGAVLSQHRTDSRLGDLGIARIDLGASADEAVTAICTSTPDIEWRQIGVLDASGRASVYHGRRMYSIHTHSVGRNCLALGNILGNGDVTARMAAGFAADPGAPLSARLMHALIAGRDAGGEVTGTLRSAALRVTAEHGIDECDLRVDISEADAVGDLARLLDAWGGRGEALRRVALAPDSVPVSRALFEASIARIRELDLVNRFPTERHRASWDIKD
ncbi:MAG: putative Ntn-hydrolase superfamily protein [Paracoccaceae bacterium]|jgi:uncharacterized Ntn-hydrolase superfamily protein